MPKKYQLPGFLTGIVTPAHYESWLRRKANAHLKRDRGRGNDSATGEIYRNAIHAAVIHSQGRDAYTGEQLDWHLIGSYDNEQSAEHGRQYKHSLALLPTVDHIGDGTGEPDFVICGWRTNDAKHDLSLDDFLSLCRRVLEHNGYVVTVREAALGRPS